MKTSAIMSIKCSEITNHTSSVVKIFVLQCILVTAKAVCRSKKDWQFRQRAPQTWTSIGK